MKYKIFSELTYEVIEPTTYIFNIQVAKTLNQIIPPTNTPHPTIDPTETPDNPEPTGKESPPEPTSSPKPTRTPAGQTRVIQPKSFSERLTLVINLQRWRRTKGSLYSFPYGNQFQDGSVCELSQEPALLLGLEWRSTSPAATSSADTSRKRPITLVRPLLCRDFMV